MKKIFTYSFIICFQLVLIFAFCFSKDVDSKTIVSYNDNMFKMSDNVLLLYSNDEISLENEDDNNTDKEEVTEDIVSEDVGETISEPEPVYVPEVVPEPVIEQPINNDIAYLKSFAKNLVINEYGWTEQDYLALVNLWDRESGWNVYARNMSGAYGIPQAYPGNKMSAFGSDWETNGETQIRWGLFYIKSQYINPSNAWANFSSYGWY